jgi:hypothetical protein
MSSSYVSEERNKNPPGVAKKLSITISDLWLSTKLQILKMQENIFL